MQVFLMGFMGCGKSTIGKKLANKLGAIFIDLDTSIETIMGCSIQDAFALKGEDYFREKEKEALEAVVKSRNIVVALGGGTPCFFNNIETIRNNGVSVYLELNSASIFSRLSSNRGDRPLLNSLNENELQLYIDKMLEEREDYYLQADIIISSKNFNANKYEELVSQIKNYSK